MTKTALTLCMIYNDTDILLGKKKRGFGTGYFNGFGGHVENGETIEDAAYREVREEILVEPRNLKKRGVLNFFFSGGAGSASGGEHMPEELEGTVAKYAFVTKSQNFERGEVGISRHIHSICRGISAKPQPKLCDCSRNGIRQQSLRVHVFSTSEFEGEPKETEEMEPRWYPLDKIPYEMMWADDIHWLPLLLRGKNFTGDFYFKDAVTLLRHKIREI